EIVEANAALTDNPGQVNQAPTGDGWFFKLKPSDPGEFAALMDEAAYAAYVASLS
ncbi:MAG: glycine cleavage system protein H, partial [Dokdonella sp.]|nr:glycine cleavage system protein H [Dokdonella sp.]